jgi:hypothetical protein
VRFVITSTTRSGSVLLLSVGCNLVVAAARHILFLRATRLGDLYLILELCPELSPRLFSLSLRVAGDRVLVVNYFGLASPRSEELTGYLYDPTGPQGGPRIQQDASRRFGSNMGSNF